MWKIWLIIFFLFITAEFLRHDYFFLWLATGALITLFTSLIISNVFIILIIFLGISFISSFLLSGRIPSKFKKLETSSFTTETLIGSQGKVIRNIGPTTLQSGLVKLDGEIWSAISSTNKSISRGSLVEVTSVEGVRLTVFPIQDKRKKEEI